MELSTNIKYVRKQRGTTEPRDILECAEIIRDAGFKYIDFHTDLYIYEDNWEEKTKKTVDEILKMGLVIDQTHAIHHYENYTPEDYKVYMQRAFETSKLAGAKHIVIHADYYTPDENGFNFDKALNTVYEFYAPYVEYAKKAGLGVAVENLFEWEEGKRARFTSFVEEQKAVIEKFNDPCVTACWDTSHGRISYGKNHMDALRQLGSLVTCTHISDSIGKYPKDLHLSVFSGDTEWEKLAAYLKSIGYDGKFTYEMVYGTYPDELIRKYFRLFYETGEYIIRR